jgi:HK97 family phage major capsid protein
MATLKEQLAALKKEAEDILMRANRGESTPGDNERAPELVKEIDTVTAKVEAARKGQALVQEIGGVGPGESTYLKEGAPIGRESATGTTEGRLSFNGFAPAIVRGMKAYSGNVAPMTKGLVPSGETVVTVPLVNPGNPIPGTADLETPARLVDVLPVAVRQASVYRFLKQVPVADAGGAGVVAPGDLKPTMKLSLDDTTSRLRVIAVLSEPLDRFLLEDESTLRTWVGAELADGIQTALETEVLTGDGTGEHFTGLSHTIGIQTQAYAGTALDTLQYGLSKLQNLGISPQFIALSAADWLAVQTYKNGSGDYYIGGPVNAPARTAWGAPVVVVPGLTTGEGYIVGADTLALSTDGAGVRVDWGTPGDNFTRNQITARCEGRFNLDVIKPHGIVKLTMTE